MRTAIVFFEGRDRKKILDIAKGLSKGLESQGHQVDIVDGDHDVNTKLTVYQYICVGTSSTSFIGGKVSPVVSTFLAGAGIIAGKRCFAFVAKSGLRTGKTLHTIMKAMECEGMFLKYSDVLSSAEEAEAVGKRLHIE